MDTVAVLIGSDQQMSIVLEHSILLYLGMAEVPPTAPLTLVRLKILVVNPPHLVHGQFCLLVGHLDLIATLCAANVAFAGQPILLSSLLLPA